MRLYQKASPWNEFVPDSVENAVSVAPPLPAPPIATIHDLLAANSANTSDTAAFRRLLSLWGTAMSDDKDPCGQARRAGLACLEQRGSWAQVRTLARQFQLDAMTRVIRQGLAVQIPTP